MPPAVPCRCPRFHPLSAHSKGACIRCRHRRAAPRSGCSLPLASCQAGRGPKAVSDPGGETRHRHERVHADDIGTALHPLVQPLRGVRAVLFGAMLAGKGHVGPPRDNVFVERLWRGVNQGPRGEIRGGLSARLRQRPRGMGLDRPPSGLPQRHEAASVACRADTRSGLSQPADVHACGSMTPAEIHSAGAPKLFRRTEPPQYPTLVSVDGSNQPLANPVRFNSRDLPTHRNPISSSCPHLRLSLGAGFNRHRTGWFCPFPSHGALSLDNDRCYSAQRRYFIKRSSKSCLLIAPMMYPKGTFARPSPCLPACQRRAPCTIGPLRWSRGKHRGRSKQCRSRIRLLTI